MTTSERIVERLGGPLDPFHPFRIRLTDGQVFDIRHGEMLMVGRSSVRIRVNHDSRAPLQWHSVPTTSIESVESLDETQVAATWGI